MRLSEEQERVVIEQEMLLAMQLSFSLSSDLHSHVHTPIPLPLPLPLPSPISLPIFPNTANPFLNPFPNVVPCIAPMHRIIPCGSASGVVTEGNSSPEKYEVADIFRIYGKEYRKNNRLTIQQLKVMAAIEKCRTGAFGFHIDICDGCGHIERVPNSCRNRHCPKCQGNKRIAWVEKRVEDLLPVPYFHAVFTLPDNIFPMCLYNQNVIYDLLFHSAAETLKEFGKDPKWLGALIGFFAVLHTWGQLMPVHPHLHIVIPAGGINEDTGEWVRPKYEKNNFLFPVQALSQVFRGKFISGLKRSYQKGELKFPGELKDIAKAKDFEKWLNRLVSHKWVVYEKAPFGGPEEVVRYVGKYTHRVAMTNSRIIDIRSGKIRFSYKNYKKKDDVENYKELWEETELPAEEFIRRFLHHVLPPRYHRIRHFGFQANGQNEKRQQAKESLVSEEEPGIAESSIIEKYAGMPCPVCETGIMISVVVVDGSGRVMKGSFMELSRLKEDRELLRSRKEPGVPSENTS